MDYRQCSRLNCEKFLNFFMDESVVLGVWYIHNLPLHLDNIISKVHVEMGGSRRDQIVEYVLRLMFDYEQLGPVSCCKRLDMPRKYFAFRRKRATHKKD